MIRFFVPGVPQPGGSKKAFVIGGKARVVEDAKRNKDWRAVVALAAIEAHRAGPLDGPLRLSLEFTMPRPKGHYGKQGVKASAARYHTTRPDTTKLIRSTEDALKGLLWRDDSQVAIQSAWKIYGETPGCWIEVEAIAT